MLFYKSSWIALLVFACCARSVGGALNPAYATSGVMFSPNSNWAPNGVTWSSDDPPSGNGTSRGNGQIGSDYLVYVDATRSNSGTSSITSTFEISYDLTGTNEGVPVLVSARSFIGLVAPASYFVTSAYVNQLINGQTHPNNPFDQSQGFQGVDTYYHESASETIVNYTGPQDDSFTMGCEFQLNASASRQS